MDLDGQKGAANPATIIAAAIDKRDKLRDQLRGIERQAYELETSYLQESAQCGSVLKGFEGYLSSTRSTTFLRRSRRVPLKDRLFSLSSVTSPASEEQRLAAKHEGSSAIGRPRAGGSAARGQGNVRKSGRILPREGKKFNEQDLDGEDD